MSKVSDGGVLEWVQPNEDVKVFNVSVKTSQGTIQSKIYEQTNCSLINLDSYTTFQVEVSGCTSKKQGTCGEARKIYFKTDAGGERV